MADFADGEQDLLPADRQVVAAFGDLWSRSRLLEEEPPNAKDNPIYNYLVLEYLIDLLTYRNLSSIEQGCFRKGFLAVAAERTD